MMAGMDLDLELIRQKLEALKSEHRDLDDVIERLATHRFGDMSDLLDTPMIIVTAFDGERRAGCLVGFWTQCSIDPPRYLVCISKANHTSGVAAGSEVLAVHLVPDDRFDLAELFGGQTGDQVDKLARCEWTPGPAGVPILAGCPDWFAGRELGRMDGGDHDAIVLEPVDLSAGEPEGPFVHYRRARQITPGHPA